MHGKDGADLLVQLPAVRVGAITFQRPWVLLAGLGGPTPGALGDLEALVGSALLLPFAQAGFDMHRSRLELAVDRAQWEHTGEVAADGHILEGEGAPAAGGPGSHPDDHLFVPPPGEFLGFFLAPPVQHAGTEPDMLPRLHVVLPGTAAARAGLRVDDHLLAIDGIPCALAAPMALWPRLWPAEGSSVTLTLRRETPGDPDGEILVVTLP